MWGQGLWEAKHQEGGEEEQGTTEQEAAPPGSDPARVVRSDVQVAWQQRGHSLVDIWAVGTLMKGPVHRVQGLSNLMEVGWGPGLGNYPFPVSIPVSSITGDQACFPFIFLSAPLIICLNKNSEEPDSQGWN